MKHNHPRESPEGGRKDLLTAVDGNAITYDAIGNPLTYYDGSTMVWGEGRNLQSITKNGQTHSYLYDANGLRIRKTNPDGSYILYHLTNGRYLGESHYNALGQHQKDIRYTYDQNETVIGIGIRNSATASWTEYYFEKNLQGDIIAVYTAENGASGLPELVASYSYDAWGNILSATGSLAQTNPFRYRGYYYDTETSFYYLQSRYYNPSIGRFLNADVLYSTGQGILDHNMFAYCKSNPVMYTDSTGYWTGLDDFIAGLVGGVAGVVSRFVGDAATSISSGSWQLSSWQTYVGDFFGGAAGGISTLYAGPFAGSGIAAGSSTLFGQLLENAFGEQKRSDNEIALDVFYDTAEGVFMGKFIPIKIPGITSGRNSMQSVFKSGLTKIKNKIASKMSLKVVGKGIISEFVDGLGSTFLEVLEGLVDE